MDVATLRVAFAVMAGVLLLLFYVAAYRSTHAPFSGWWTVSLLLFSLGSLAYLANGTSWQVVLNPAGNALAVGGAEAAWCAARTLRTPPPRWWWLLIVPALAVLAGAVDHPSTDIWAGGAIFLLLMAASFAATCVELNASRYSWVAQAETGPIPDASFAILTRMLSLASGVLAFYYAGRTVAYLWVGPYDDVFVTWFGSAPTTLLLIVQLVTVSFSMSSLSTQQQLADLRRRAVYDELTGLLRSQEFRVHAARALPHLNQDNGIAFLAMADLDHFKLVNDELGHAAGDQVLRDFGRVAQLSLGPAAICGRLGGEEFALLFSARSIEQAEQRLTTMTGAFQHAVTLADGRVPTVSVGVVQGTDHETLDQLLERADHALYRAKHAGRARIVRG